MEEEYQSSAPPPPATLTERMREQALQERSRLDAQAQQSLMERLRHQPLLETGITIVILLITLMRYGGSMLVLGLILAGLALGALWTNPSLTGRSSLIPSLGKWNTSTIHRSLGIALVALFALWYPASAANSYTSHRDDAEKTCYAQALADSTSEQDVIDQTNHCMRDKGYN